MPPKCNEDVVGGERREAAEVGFKKGVLGICGGFLYLTPTTNKEISGRQH